MFCPKCGKINPDTENLCSGCGAELHEEKAVLPKKSKKGLKIALTVALLVVVVVVVLVLNGCNPGNITKDNMSF